jgi:hypothetical protein
VPKHTSVERRFLDPHGEVDRSAVEPPIRIHFLDVGPQPADEVTKRRGGGLRTVSRDGIHLDEITHRLGEGRTEPFVVQQRLTCRRETPRIVQTRVQPRLIDERRPAHQRVVSFDQDDIEAAVCEHQGCVHAKQPAADDYPVRTHADV